MSDDEIEELLGALKKANKTTERIILMYRAQAIRLHQLEQIILDHFGEKLKKKDEMMH